MLLEPNIETFWSRIAAAVCVGEVSV